MSEQTIYNALRAGGMSRTGVCAMMGNMAMESALISTNVEDRCKVSDEVYTQAVDDGTISKEHFIHDSYGYGLCQWTYYSRKENLYNLAKGNGVSIGNEAIQCKFCLWELSHEHEGLYNFLCVTENLAEATRRICAEYERPAVNNFADRINAAQRYFNLLAANDKGCSEDSCPIEPEEETCKVDVRILNKGCLGRDVFLLQCGLNDMGFSCVPDGDFGQNTERAVKELQKANGLDQTGVACWFVWQTILNAR